MEIEPLLQSLQIFLLPMKASFICKKPDRLQDYKAIFEIRDKKSPGDYGLQGSRLERDLELTRSRRNSQVTSSTTPTLLPL